MNYVGQVMVHCDVSAVFKDCSDAKEVEAMAPLDGLQFLHFLHALRDFYMTIVKHILRYLRHIAQFGLHLISAPSTILVAFSDTNWAGSPGDPQGGVLYSLNQI
jgi:hypothetical protein